MVSRKLRVGSIILHSTLTYTRNLGVFLHKHSNKFTPLTKISLLFLALLAHCATISLYDLLSWQHYEELYCAPNVKLSQAINLPNLVWAK